MSFEDIPLYLTSLMKFLYIPVSVLYKNYMAILIYEITFVIHGYTHQHFDPYTLLLVLDVLQLRELINNTIIWSKFSGKLGRVRFLLVNMDFLFRTLINK